MSAAKRYRWVCPDCGGAVLGSSQPRKTSIVRYCLDCSRRTGYLVERSCPVLDRARTEKRERDDARRTAREKRERAAARAKRERDAERAKRERDRAEEAARESRRYRGVDLDVEARRLWATAALSAYHRGAPLPTIDLRRRRRGGYSSGRAWTRRVTMTIGGSLTEVLMVLAHELAHSAVERTGRHGHDAVWASAYSDAARERWGSEHFTGIRANRGYAVDPYVYAGIRRAIGDETSAPTRAVTRLDDDV